jgi:hypothetical protein
MKQLRTIVTALLSTVFFLLLAHGVSDFAFAQGFSPTGAPAQSVSGDSYCGGGGKPCSLGQIGGVIRAFLTNVVLRIGIVVLFLYIMLVIAQTLKAKAENKPDALKEAYKRITNALLGFLMLMAAVSGFLYFLIQFIGVKAQFLQFLLSGFVDIAYAQTPTYLENPVTSVSLYDFLLVVVRLFIRFFIFPGVIFMWVYTGFSFVQAQGKPDAINKAKSWLLWATVCTILIFVVEGFLFALRNTVNQILPGVTTQTRQQVNTNGTPDLRVAPAANSYGAACTLPDGLTGQFGSDNRCASTARGVQAKIFQEGDVCTTPSGKQGVVSAQNTCQASGGM